MKTDDLIAMLARGPVGADGLTTERRLAAAVAASALVVAVLVLVVLGPRLDVAAAIQLPAFWVKLAFPATLAAAAYAATCRLARPGSRLDAHRVVPLVAPFVVALALASTALLGVPTGERAGLVAGHSALVCVAFIAALSVPGFVAAFAALRALAPTRPSAAGACAGLLAGALAATLYAIHCDEMEAPFIVVWYGLGMALPTALGALLGPRLLRWA